MDLEIITLSEVRERQIPYGIIYAWNLKEDANELIYKTETASQTENKLMVTQGEEGYEINEEFGIGRYKELYVKQINNKVLLHNTENYIQYPVCSCLSAVVSDSL